MGVDQDKKRLFVAAVANNTLEVVDMTGGKVIKSLAGFKDTQDALFMGGDFNKLYVSSLDGQIKVFQGENFCLVKDFKVEPDPNRLITPEQAYEVVCNLREPERTLTLLPAGTGLRISECLGLQWRCQFR